jgi:hypothetical protein
MYREFLDSREGFDAASEAEYNAYLDNLGDDMAEYDDDYELDDFEHDFADDDMDESMDGDFDSGMASAGFGTDEDYGYYGGYDE